MNKFLKMFGVSSQDEKKLNRLYDDCVKIGIEPKVVAPFSFGIKELVDDAIRELHILIGNELERQVYASELGDILYTKKIDFRVFYSGTGIDTKFEVNLGGNELNSTLVHNFIKNGIEPVVKTLKDELKKLDKQ